MLKPGDAMRSASRAAESSAVSKLIPEDDGEEAAAMGEEAEAAPRLESSDLQGQMDGDNQHTGENVA